MIKSYHEKRGLVAFEKAITAGGADRLWYGSTTLVNMLEAEAVLGENSTAGGIDGSARAFPYVRRFKEFPTACRNLPAKRNPTHTHMMGSVREANSGGEIFV